MLEKLPHDEPLIRALYWIIHMAVRLLAVLMTIVIVLGVVDVAWILYQKVIEQPIFVLTISDILAAFGAFMAVLIAMEIFVNIVMYLRDDTIHVKIVMATALMAIARKVIILDYDNIKPEYIWATATVVLAMSVGYWLICKAEGTGPHANADMLTGTPQNPAVKGDEVDTPNDTNVATR